MLKKVKAINEPVIPNVFKYVSSNSVRTGKALQGILEGGNAFVILHYAIYQNTQPIKMLANYMSSQPDTKPRIKDITLLSLKKSMNHIYRRFIYPIVVISQKTKDSITKAIENDIGNEKRFTKLLISDLNLNEKADVIHTVNEQPYAFVIKNNVFFILPYTFHLFIDHCYTQNVHPPWFAYNVYQEFYNSINDMKFKPEELMLGTDPEFNIYEKDKKKKLALYNTYKSANNYFMGLDIEVGTDGCLGELRPKPSPDPLILTGNIQRLLTKVDKRLKQERGQEFFIEVGGGCRESIGGHIHLGHNILCNMPQGEIKRFVGILDDFLYYPIRNNMLGGLRAWQGVEGIGIEYGYGSYSHNLSQVEQVIKNLKAFNPKDKGYDNFDTPSAYRSQNHGIEYRSLPSFIVDPRLTYLILKLAKGITIDYLTLRENEQEMQYNDPPEKEDYQKYLDPSEAKDFLDYLYGKKKDIFLKNILDNWDIKHLLDVTFFNETYDMNTDMLAEIERELNIFFQKPYEKIKKDIFSIALLTSENIYPERWLKIEPDAHFIAMRNRIQGNFPRTLKDWLIGFLQKNDLIMTFNNVHYMKHKSDKTYWIDMFKSAMSFYLNYADVKPYLAFNQPIQYTAWEKKEQIRLAKEQEKYLKRLKKLSGGDIDMALAQQQQTVSLGQAQMTQQQSGATFASQYRNAIAGDTIVLSPIPNDDRMDF